MNDIVEIFSFYMEHSFVRYALIVGVLIALCSSLLGVTPVLNAFSFIGDGLSHTRSEQWQVAAVLNLTNDMLFVLPATVICAVLLLRTGNSTKIKGDAAICYDLSRLAGNRISADEFVFHFFKSFGRRLQYAVRFGFHTYADKG